MCFKILWTQKKWFKNVYLYVRCYRYKYGPKASKNATGQILFNFHQTNIFSQNRWTKLFYKFNLLRLTRLTEFYEFNTKMYMWISVCPFLVSFISNGAIFFQTVKKLYYYKNYGAIYD